MLAFKVEVIVRELLKLNKINFHSVTSRAKTVKSYRRKASKEKYKDPQTEITDMAGIRVITYTDSDAKKAAEIIKEPSKLEIYPELSIDKSEELGVDRVGYRGIHYVANLGKQRLMLPENSILWNHVFEIQIRSILQHAWAEFEHDRNYKFAGVLPNEIRRRFSIAAANLESVDREFNDISQEIDGYILEVGEKTKKGDLTIPIDSTSLATYLKQKFRVLIKQGIVEPSFKGIDSVIIDELQIMGIYDLAKLDTIIPTDYVKKLAKYNTYSVERGTNFLGIVRDILIICDARTYFEKAWRNMWDGIDRSAAILYRSYDVEIDKYARKYGLDLFDRLPRG
jgi:ppGpp synthetase/RelA/SpoT-type nucleotidyltranferase